MLTFMKMKFPADQGVPDGMVPGQVDLPRLSSPWYTIPGCSQEARCSWWGLPFLARISLSFSKGLPWL